MARERIRKEKIVTAALRLLDETGLDGLTMRALAKALDVQAPSLYWHYPSKGDLLEDVADAMVATVARQPAPPGADPAERLHAVALELRQALLAHRDGGRAFAGTYAVRENILRIAETLTAGFRALGATPDMAPHAAFNLVYFVLGSVIEEQGFRERWGDAGRADAAREAFADVTRERYPALHAGIDGVLSGDFDGRFSLGVRALLDGSGGKR